MPEEAVWGLLPLALFFLGCVLLWFASWTRQRSQTANPFARRAVVVPILGWAGVVMGVTGIAVTMAFFFAPVVLIVGAVVIVAGVLRYWRSEYRYLVWMLAEAAQRGIPLERAARAFAGERVGGVSRSARRLADYLEAAMPLSVAMVRSGLWVSAEVRMAADVGEKTGTLGPSLQRAVKQSNAFDSVLGSLLAKFFYLSCIISVMLAIVTFMMIRIVPIFTEMFEEFELRLPAATVMLISVSRFIVNYWFLLFPVIALCVMGVVLGLLIYMGVPLQSLPVVRRFADPIDSATVLGSLALSVEHRQPITDNLMLLSVFTRSGQSREKLEDVVVNIESGMHWCDALQESRLITKAQQSVLRSAERAGNLGWALSEMADSTLRRAASRAHAVLGFVFPTCLIGFGMCVLFVAVGMLAPLFSLIGALA